MPPARKRSAPPLRDIAIIGAGPAGLIAAETLARAGHPVTIYDRMPSPARKFLLAGRGGLNLTHAEPLDAFTGRYGPGARRLAPAIAAFPPERLRAWADDLGETTFTGTSGRVFPKGFKATPLLRAWLRQLDSLGVTLKSRAEWQGFDAEGRLLFSTPEGPFTVAPAATLLALGGASWPRLGADGGWTGALAAAGVAITPLVASNCGALIRWSDPFAARFAGAPLKSCRFSIGDATARAEAVVTRHGLEGGAIYALSGALRAALASGEAELAIDLRPDVPEQALAARLAAARKGETLSNKLRKAAGLLPVVIGILRESKGGPLPADPAALAARIKACRITIAGVAGLERAISSAGGVAWDAVDETFMLKELPGVFVAGEMLDWDAPTGGYLLQACFSTGVAAAEGIMGWVGRR